MQDLLNIKAGVHLFTTIMAINLQTKQQDDPWEIIWIFTLLITLFYLI